MNKCDYSEYISSLFNVGSVPHNFATHPNYVIR